LARVTYAVLALAFATLVSGFFFRTSSLPLLLSIGLSGVVFVLILAGWSRRLRAAGQLGLAGDDAIEEDLADDILIVDLDETGEITEFAPPKARAKASGAKTAVLERKPARKPAKKSPKKSPRKSAATTRTRRAAREDDLDFMPLPSDDSDETAVVPPPPPASRAKKKPPARKAKPPVPKAKATAALKPKAKPKPKPPERRVVTIPGRDRYHLPGCRFAQGPGAARITESAAKRRGLVACSVCLK
jgi:hypothetical protein